MIIADRPPHALNFATNRPEPKLYIWFEKEDWRFKGDVPGGARAVIEAIKAEIPSHDRSYVDGIWVIFSSSPRYREKLETLRQYYLRPHS